MDLMHRPPLSLSDVAAQEEAAARRRAKNLRMLEELADIGMNLARFLALRAQDELHGGSGGDNPAIGAAFVRVSRAVRQTIAMQTYLEATPPWSGKSLAPKAPPAAPWPKENPAEERPETGEFHRLGEPVRKSALRRLLTRAIDSDPRAVAVDEMRRDLAEFIEGDELFDVNSRPIGETIRRVCRALKVRPDTERWEPDEISLLMREGFGDDEPPDTGGSLADTLFALPDEALDELEAEMVALTAPPQDGTAEDDGRESGSGPDPP